MAFEKIEDFDDIEDVSEIRAESGYFYRLCLFHQTKIAILVSTALSTGGGVTKENLYSIYGLIKNFETDLEGILTPAYWHYTKAIKKDVVNFKVLDDATMRLFYYNRLMEWKRYMIREICNNTNILPTASINVTVWSNETKRSRDFEMPTDLWDEFNRNYEEQKPARLKAQVEREAKENAETTGTEQEPARVVEASLEQGSPQE